MGGLLEEAGTVSSELMEELVFRGGLSNLVPTGKPVCHNDEKHFVMTQLHQHWVVWICCMCRSPLGQAPGLGYQEMNRSITLGSQRPFNNRGK